MYHLRGLSDFSWPHEVAGEVSSFINMMKIKTNEVLGDPTTEFEGKIVILLIGLGMISNEKMSQRNS
jgi:hypothetical protein